MSITIPASVLIDGQWRTATWTAGYDPKTSRLYYTASVQGMASVAIYITDDDVRVLRKMAEPDHSRLQSRVIELEAQAGIQRGHSRGQERRIESLENAVAELQRRRPEDAL